MSLFAKGPSDVHTSPVAGSWYPADAGELRDTIRTHLARASRRALIEDLPAAFITPHAGYQWSGDCAANLYGSLQGAAGDRVKRVILLAPSHYALIGGASVLPVRAFRTPLGDIPVDEDAAAALLENPAFATVPDAHVQEHSDEMQLPFLQEVLPEGWRLVDVILQGTGPDEWTSIARALLPYVDDATLIVASSDFTHYGPGFHYVPFVDDVPDNLRKLDHGAVDALLSLDPREWARYKESTGITACGFEAVGTLLTLMNLVADERPDFAAGFRGRLVDYYRSGDINNDFTTSVSYAAVVFEPGTAPASRAPVNPALTAEEQRYLLALARGALASHLRGEPVETPEIPADMIRLSEDRGVFVTLTEHGRLRGCIGSILPQEPLARAVARHVVQSASEDFRFQPVRERELDDIRIEISVLTRPVEVRGADDVVLGRDGILLDAEGHRSVFLPQVAVEQGWGIEETLSNLAMKAGLEADAWKSPRTILSTFQAQVFEEGEG